jgi:hypothetical protein
MPTKKTAKAEPKFESTRPPAFAPHPTNPKESVQVGPQKPDMEGYSGKYHKIGEPKDAPPYGLKVLDESDTAAHFGRTHHLRSEEFSWSGSEKEFKEQFEKA